jgi:hypothetical protein
MLQCAAMPSKKRSALCQPSYQGEARHNFVFTCLLCDYLFGFSSIGGKLEVILSLIVNGVDQHLAGLMEAIAADALGSAEIVKELLGPQRHLAASLCRLADFLHGRLDLCAAGTSPLLTRLGFLIKVGHAPSCRAVLLERLLTELRQDHLLDRKEPEAEGRLLEEVVYHLRHHGTDEMLGGALAEKAVSIRLLRHRQAILRKGGRHEAADALARNWNPDIKLLGKPMLVGAGISPGT